MGWYRLDNAGKLFPSITSTRISTVFRVSATLAHTIDPETLQSSLEAVIKRYPCFDVTLKRGLFWYYYDKSKSTPDVEEEIFSPCMFLLYKRRGMFPFRVLYFKRRISLEISHSITDGTGALAFLKSLVAEYVARCGDVALDGASFFEQDETPHPEEAEDAFHRYYKGPLPTPHQARRAFLFPFELMPKGEYGVVTGIVETDTLLALSRTHGATVTQLLTALYFHAIQEMVETSGESADHPVVINLLVNLRRFFPSNTLRNFFVSVTPTLDLRLGHYDFEEILTVVKHDMGRMLNEKYLSQLISRNVTPEKSILVRLLPLFIKKWMTLLIFREWGEKNNTTSLSNLGNVVLPEALASHVERFEFTPPPGRQNVIKLGIISYNGKAHISFGSLTHEKPVERFFFRKLRKMGVGVKIESN